MISSPQNGPEFENAIRETLVQGEELISFANGWVHIDRVGFGLFFEYKRNPDRYFQWIYLALTNINIRSGQFASDKNSVKAEAYPTGVWGLDQVVSYRTEKYPYLDYSILEQPKGNKFNIGRDYVDYSLLRAEHRTGIKQKEMKKLASKRELAIHAVQISLANGDGDKIYSFFDEMSTLGRNIEEMKSGALLASQATKAADALGVLTPLLQEGIISQEEFDRAKAGFLGTTTKAQENSASQIRQLHSLHKDGVLTEGEFNMKKWDILSKN